MFLFFLPGCASSPQPRVIADRVFADRQLHAVLTTFPGEPEELTLLRSCTRGDVAAPSQPTVIEGRPGWEIRCVAPGDAREWDLHADLRYAGRRYRITIPFRYHKVYVAGQGPDVRRWTAGREIVTDLGPDAFHPSPGPAQANSGK